MLSKKLSARVSTAARIAADILVLIAVALVVVSFVETVYAGAPRQGNSTTMNGEIVAVDNVGYTTILTVLSPQIGPFPNNELNIFTNRDTMTKVCNAREPARDVHVGGSATITYHETGGVAVANNISERC